MYIQMQIKKWLSHKARKFQWEKMIESIISLTTSKYKHWIYKEDHQNNLQVTKEYKYMCNEKLVTQQTFVGLEDVFNTSSA